MQITQFVIDIFATYFVTYTHFAYKYAPSLPVLGDCSGTDSATWIGSALLTSYLALFIQFYHKTYKAGAGARANGVNGATSRSELK